MIKNGYLILINKNKIVIWKILPGLLLGIGLIIWGFFDNESTLEFEGLSSKVFIGIFVLLAQTFNYERYQVEITNRSIIFNDALYWDEWNYKDINQIIINQNGFTCIEGVEREKVQFDDDYKDLKPKIEKFLFDRVKNKIIIE